MWEDDGNGSNVGAGLAGTTEEMFPYVSLTITLGDVST